MTLLISESPAIIAEMEKTGNFLGFSSLSEALEEYTSLPEAALLAGMDIFFTESLDYIQEAYVGEHSSDEDFAKQIAEDMGYEIPTEWPFCHVDWGFAARELMYDYSNDKGFYFRNI